MMRWATESVLGFSVKEASPSRPTSFLELQSLQAQEGSWGALCGSSKPQHGGEEWFLLLWAVFPGNQGDVGLTSSGDIRLRLFTYRYLLPTLANFSFPAVPNKHSDGGYLLPPGTRNLSMSTTPAGPSFPGCVLVLSSFPCCP